MPGREPYRLTQTSPRLCQYEGAVSRKHARSKAGTEVPKCSCCPCRSEIVCQIVTSGRLVRLDLSPVVLDVAVSGSDSVQLVLKPLSESLGRLVLLIRVRVRDDGVGL